MVMDKVLIHKHAGHIRVWDGGGGGGEGKEDVPHKAWMVWHII